MDKNFYGNNYLVLEKYFPPEYWGREYMRPILSVTKTRASALIGIAIEQGKIEGVKATLLDYFAEYGNIKNLDTRKQKITLENALTMTAGFNGCIPRGLVSFMAWEKTPNMWWRIYSTE